MSLSKVINHGEGEKHSLSKALLKSFSLVTATAIGCISIASSATAVEFYFAFGSRGSGDSQFNNPFGIAVGGGGKIYVADTANNRVQVFDSHGGFLSTVGDADLSMPQGIAVDSAGNIYVADTANNSVQVFNSLGNPWLTFGSSGTGNGEFFSPTGIAVDSDGKIYVADTNNNRVQVFNPNGGFLYAFGSSGSGNGQFNRPSGIAVGGGGNIYVADTFNNRVQVFRTPEPSGIIGLGILGGGLVVRRLAKRG